jgi:Uncharacterized conserved protein (COG2071)
MNIPALRGTIRRRILVNYRISPDVVKALLPVRFRPKLIAGYSIGGICLIRLEEIRPKGLPGFIGISSENSAHRIAVEWEDDNGRQREGVFVPRRDTDSRLNSLAGGRVFPGVHQLSRFTVSDQDGQISLRVVADDIESPLVDLQVTEADGFPETSVFTALSESSKFFEAGCIGYSSRPDSCTLDGLMLEVPDWRVSPLKVHYVRSAYYDNRSVFPSGSIEFDHALLMRDIPHLWHSEPAMTASTQTANQSWERMSLRSAPAHRSTQRSVKDDTR